MRKMISNCASSTMIDQFEMRKVTRVSDQVLELPYMFFGRVVHASAGSSNSKRNIRTACDARLNQCSGDTGIVFSEISPQVITFF